ACEGSLSLGQYRMRLSYEKVLMGASTFSIFCVSSSSLMGLGCATLAAELFCAGELSQAGMTFCAGELFHAGGIFPVGEMRARFSTPVRLAPIAAQRPKSSLSVTV